MIPTSVLLFDTQDLPLECSPYRSVLTIILETGTLQASHDVLVLRAGDPFAANGYRLDAPDVATIIANPGSDGKPQYDGLLSPTYS